MAKSQNRCVKRLYHVLALLGGSAISGCTIKAVDSKSIEELRMELSQLRWVSIQPGDYLRLSRLIVQNLYEKLVGVLLN